MFILQQIWYRRLARLALCLLCVLIVNQYYSVSAASGPAPVGQVDNDDGNISDDDDSEGDANEMDDMLNSNAWIKTGKSASRLDEDCGRVFKLGDKFSREVNVLTGAYDVQPGYYPSVVELVIPHSESDVIRCGGIIISNRHILALAACFDAYNTTRALVSTSIKRQPTDQVVKSPYWTVKTCAPNKITAENSDELMDDVVVAKLNKPLVFSDTLQPACLPKSPWPDNEEGYLVGQEIKLKNEFEPPNMLQVAPAQRDKCLSDDKFKFEIESNWQRFCAKASVFTDFRGSLCGADIGSPLLAFENGRQTVFGLFMPKDTWCLPGYTYAASFADIHLKRNEIKKLLKDCA